MRDMKQKEGKMVILKAGLLTIRLLSKFSHAQDIKLVTVLYVETVGREIKR